MVEAWYDCYRERKRSWEGRKMEGGCEQRKEGKKEEGGRVARGDAGRERER